MNTYKTQARTGLLLLKEVVLDVLLDAQSEGLMLQPKEINERIGIPRTGEDEISGTSTLILGVLRHLKAEGRVLDIYEGKIRWTISEEEANARNHGNNEMPHDINRDIHFQNIVGQVEIANPELLV